MSRSRSKAQKNKLEWLWAIPIAMAVPFLWIEQRIKCKVKGHCQVSRRKKNPMGTSPEVYIYCARCGVELDEKGKAVKS